MSGSPVAIPQPAELLPDTPDLLKKQGPSLAAAIAAIFRDPVGVIFARWNWKSALLSVALRGWIYFAASIRHGWAEVGGAVAAEVVYCAATAGFYGAITQALCDAEPEWLTALLVTFLMPVLMQWIEYLVHLYRGTHHLHYVIIGSIVMSAISSLFNWYAMRCGTLLMGEKSQSFGRDLASLPRLLGRFFAAGPQLLIESLRRSGSGQE